MSYPPAVTSSDVPGRVRRAKALLVLIYLGIPLSFLGGIFAVSALWAGQREDRAFNDAAQLVPAAMVLIGVWAGWVQRRRTAVWASAGGWLGAVAALFVGFYAYTMQIGEPFDPPYNLLVYTGVLLLPIGWLLGHWARRTLLHPPVVELADTAYDLVYPLRGVRGVRLFVGIEVVAVQERVSVPTGGSEQRTQWMAAGLRRYDGQVTSVGETGLSDAENLRPALALQRTLPSSAGPGLVLDGSGGRWTLPLDDAGTIAQIIRRRAERVGSAL
jgi:hypothetical protein